jgi:type II secretory pathway pseudopilin PulG
MGTGQQSSPLPTRSRASGFTGVEALFVLLILALCVAMAAVGFRRWVVRSRTNEAVAMLAEIASKQQAFKAGGGQFLPLRGDALAAGAAPDESPSAFYPLSAASPALSSARTPTRVDDAERWPTAWRALGLRPTGAYLYCTYLANAANDGQVPPQLRFGSALLAGAAPGPWFYALAACNLSGPGGYPDDVTIFGLSSQSGEIRTFNDSK